MNQGRPRLLGSIRQLSRHPLKRWAIAVEALLTLGYVKILLTFFSFQRYRHLFGNEQSQCQGNLRRERLADCVWAVDRISRLAPRRLNCMPRALAVQKMIKRRGAQGIIRFGVRLSPQGLNAHAWLLLNDEVLIGWLPDLDSYHALPEWPPGA